MRKDLSEASLSGFRKRLVVFGNANCFVHFLHNYFPNLQERERKQDFIPEKSEIDIANIKFDNKVVKQIIKELGIKQFVN